MTQDKDGPSDSQRPPSDEERARLREEALARGAERRRQREGATARTYPPSPLEPALRSSLRGLSDNIEQAMDEVVVHISPDRLIDACRVLKGSPDLALIYLRCLSVVDYHDELEIVYHLSALVHPHKVLVKTRISGENSAAPSVISVWRGADWHEREAHDLFGVVFEGHPDMSPLLLFEGFEGFPLRKSYEIPEQQEALGG